MLAQLLWSLPPRAAHLAYNRGPGIGDNPALPVPSLSREVYAPGAESKERSTCYASRCLYPASIIIREKHARCYWQV